MRRRRTCKVRNRAAQALRLATQSLHRSRTALGACCRRMRGRCGPVKAITATARKLAILIYRMLKCGMTCVEDSRQAYKQRYKDRAPSIFAQRVKHMGYAIVDLSSGEVVS